MVEINLGEAIASGTNLRPDSSMPITRGLQLQEQVDFRDNSAELRKQAELNKQREKLSKLMTNPDKGKWHNPKYQKEFGDYYLSEMPKLMEAYNRDPIEFAEKKQEITNKLGMIRAMDNDEHEIYGVQKKGSVTRDLVRNLHSKGGMPAVEEYNSIMWFAPAGNIDKESGVFRINDVYTKNIDKVIDENTKKVLGNDYKQVSKVGSTPMYEMDVTSADFKEKKDKVLQNLLMDKDFEKSVLYNSDFQDYYAEKLKENGMDPYQPNPDFLDKVYTEFVTNRFGSRIIPKQKMGATPRRSGGGNGPSVLISKNDGSWFMKGQPFEYFPSTKGDGSYLVGTKAGTNVVPGFLGVDKDNVLKSQQILNPNVKYLGGDEWEVTGKNATAEDPEDIGKVDMYAKVSTNDLKVTLGLDDTALAAKWGYRPKAKEKPKEQPKKDEGPYGLRNDGTKKGRGFLGPLKMKDGSGRDATEISIGVEFDGKETEIPTLVPTLTEQEKEWLLKGNDPNDRSPMGEAIVKKAIDHAKKRFKEGKGAFAGEVKQKQPEQPKNSNIDKWKNNKRGSK